MKKMKLPQQDSSTGRAIKTAVQAMIGFVAGLIVVVWGVPGVPETVLGYVQQHLVEVLIIVGVPSGLTSFAWNLMRKDVKNY